MSSPTVLAIDPGSTRAAVSHTGIVLHSGPEIHASWAVPDGIDGFRRWVVNHIEWNDGLSPHSVAVMNTWWTIDTVVCEQFIDRQVRGADRTPLLVEGAVRFIWPHVVLQPASGKNTAIPDRILAKTDYRAAFKGDHHNDRREAFRHGLWYLKKQHDPDTLALFR